MSFTRDRVFWLAVGVIFLIYVILQFNASTVGSALSLVATLVALLAAITIHEFSHAWVADQLGDSTARYLGRVSLNPLVHLDPVGTVMMVVTAITGYGIGWGKPVPIAPQRLRYGPRLGGGLVALAGPVSNLVLATLLGLGLRFAPALPPFIDLLLNTLVWINLVLAIFNLIPIPPLDGNSILLGLLSLIRDKWAWQVSQFIISLQQYGSMLLILLIVLPQFLGLNLLGGLIGPPIRFFYRLILGL
jgi:Zn-dependent protease